jgi:hypothetical protein
MEIEWNVAEATCGMWSRLKVDPDFEPMGRDGSGYWGKCTSDFYTGGYGNQF